MESFGSILAFVLRRMRDSWRLQLVIAAGILVAAVLMSSTTIYTRAVSDLSLIVSLREDLTERRQMFSYLTNLPLAGGPNESARAYAEDSITERFGDFESQRLRFQATIATQIDLPLRRGQVIPPTAYFATLDQAEENVSVVEGQWPRQPTLEDGSLTGPIEVALPYNAATAYSTGVGAELYPGGRLGRVRPRAGSAAGRSAAAAAPALRADDAGPTLDSGSGHGNRRAGRLGE